jgi:hypothetical protein
MARFAVRAPGADRCGAWPVQWAAGTARAPTPPWHGVPKSGKRRPARNVSPEGPPGDRRELRRVRVGVILAWRYPRVVAGRVRRAPRALEDVKKLLTDRWATCGDGL